MCSKPVHHHAPQTAVKFAGIHPGHSVTFTVSVFTGVGEVYPYLRCNERIVVGATAGTTRPPIARQNRASG